MPSNIDNFLRDQGLQIHSQPGRKLASNPTGPRAIDREAGTRTRPFKVIIASMSRTGTLSMYSALQKLDLAPYHMAEAIKTPSRDLLIANEALKANRYGQGKPFGREEFDRWIGDYSSTADVPMCLLYSDLLKAYPNAKVVLSTRDPDRWRASLEITVIPIMNWRIWSLLAPFSSDCHAFLSYMNVVTSVMDNWSIKAYNTHNAQVRATVPKAQLLEFKLGEHGWKELCEFLEVERPEGEFPHVNEGKGGMFIAGHVLLVNIWVVKAIKNALIKVAPVAVLVAALWFARWMAYL